MTYRYILPITYTEMGQLNIYNPIYYNENENDSLLYKQFILLLYSLVNPNNIRAGLESFGQAGSIS